MPISIETMTIDCAVRHIRTLFYQCSEDRKAYFGEPCSQCPHMPECNCDSLSTFLRISLMLSPPGCSDRWNPVYYPESTYHGNGGNPSAMRSISGLLSGRRYA